MGIWKLPVEKPRGGEDIYRMDISVHLHYGSKFWANLGPAGIHRPSKVQTTEKQRQTFEKIVNLILEVAQQTATNPDSEESFQEAYDMQEIHRKRVYGELE